MQAKGEDCLERPTVLFCLPKVRQCDHKSQNKHKGHRDEIGSSPAPPPENQVRWEHVYINVGARGGQRRQVRLELALTGACELPDPGPEPVSSERF